jgi:predicted metalloprotease with PDZ domain
MKKLFLFLVALPCVAFADVHYFFRPDPSAGELRVAIKVDASEAEQEFRIPAWCPGFYFLLNYQEKISKVEGTDATGRTLSVRQKEGDPRAWVVSNPTKGFVTLSYRVKGDDPGLGFFGVSVKGHTAFINGPAAFMYLPGRLEEKCTLKPMLPEGWKIATGMSQDDGGQFYAGGYDELIDHPIQVGIFESRRFTVEGLPFEVVFVTTTPGSAKADLDAEAERLKALSAPAIKLYGGAPFKKYVYILHLAVGGFGGGLEHRASTTIATGNTRPLGIDTLATHEYFHTWNVKQIRPKVLGPFDYTKQVRTNNLWFAEGVTDYYANITAYRSGLMDENLLLRTLSSEVSELQGSKARLEISLEYTSWNAWENGGFGVRGLSYYNKGLIAGLLFDAAIRSATEGAKSLDDVMRLLYKRHRLPQPGYDEDEIRAAINEVAGTDLSSLYNTVVRTPGEVPYEVLRGIGLRTRQNERGAWMVEVDPDANPNAKARLGEWLRR